jgi:hypothetical protein
LPWQQIISARCRSDQPRVRIQLHPDGSVDHQMLTGLIGLTVTTRPEPLPGYAPGEGYANDEAGRG